MLEDVDEDFCGDCSDGGLDDGRLRDGVLGLGTRPVWLNGGVDAQQGLVAIEEVGLAGLFVVVLVGKRRRGWLKVAVEHGHGVGKKKKRGGQMGAGLDQEPKRSRAGQHVDDCR